MGEEGGVVEFAALEVGKGSAEVEESDFFVFFVGVLEGGG